MTPGAERDDPVRELEAQREWYENALAVGLSLAEGGAGGGPGGDPEEILRDVLQRLQRLYGFTALGYACVNETDQSFELGSCLPADRRDYIQREMDHQIEAGTFGWALTQTRALVGRPHDLRSTVITHALSTRSRIRGMFIGFLPCPPADIKDSMMHALSIILLNAANALESHALYQLLRGQNRNLEQIVEQRTRDLEKARVEAETANRAKSHFIANISHEIRTPLTSIIGFAELGSRSGASLRLEDCRDALATIHTAGRHLLGIINNILDLTKIESQAGEMEVLSVSPFGVLARVDAVMSQQALKKHLEFSIRCDYPFPRRIATDPTRLAQILINLCGNAIKFTERGFVRLEASYSEQRHEVDLTVADSGIGLTDAQRDTLFRPFSQADASTTRKYGGTGLGLYISRLLAEKLGGRLVVDSVPGHGSRFTVTLPVGHVPAEDLTDAWQVEAEAEISLAAAPESAPLHGHLLVAEDDVNIQRLIALYLRDTGLSVTIVDNGRQAVEQALMGDYDMLLTDLQMPEMGGLEAAAWLRKSGFRKPIVVLSASAGDDLAARCREAGCTDYLPKPFDGRKLFALLGKHLGAGVESRADEQLARDPAYRAARAAFIEYLRGAPAEMEARVKCAEWDALRQIAHRIKGTAGAFGYAEAGVLAGRMEAQAKEGHMDAVEATVREFRREVERALAADPAARSAA